MRTIIAGGRDFIFGQKEVDFLDGMMGDIDLVISGTARGADTCGEMWASINCIETLRMPADWKNFGYSAGRKRNEEMAKVADMVILFPGGKGTDHMGSVAKERGLKVVRYYRSLK